MNRGGSGQRGERWLGWFGIRIYEVRAAGERQEATQAQARIIREPQKRGARVEEHAGKEHGTMREFFDDGTPLGASRNEECQIESGLRQMERFISGAGAPRGRRRPIAWSSKH